MAKIKLKKKAKLKNKSKGTSKAKSIKSVTKRFRCNAGGTLISSRSGRNHNLIRKTSSQIKKLGRLKIASRAVVRCVKKYLSFGALKIKK